MPDRAELRRQARALRKLAQRSPFHTAPAEGVAPLTGSSLKRATELFIQACQTEGHPYAGLSIADIRDIEAERRPVPNRAMARRYGIRSGYTRRLHARLALAAEIKRADRADERAAQKAAREERAAAKSAARAA